MKRNARCRDPSTNNLVIVRTGSSRGRKGEFVIIFILVWFTFSGSQQGVLKVRKQELLALSHAE